MREIKFRAWHETWGWARPEDITVLGDGTGYVDYRGESGDVVETYELTHKKLHLEQYTGITDKKNGKEIYEGDIVAWGGGGREIFNRLGCWYIEGVCELGYCNTVKRIGNKWENPELLEK